MSETETKTYVFNPDNNNMLSMLCPLLQLKGIDPNALLAMLNSNGFGNGNWFIWILFMFLFWGRNGNLYGNDSGTLQNQLNNDYGRDLLMQAINGNRNAVSELSSTLNCDINSVRTTLTQLVQQTSNVGSQVGMTGGLIINAIQQGNCNIANQMALCCCENKQMVLLSNYENQIATLNLTNQLSNKIDSVDSNISNAILSLTNLINDKFCQLEQRELQNKIDMLREQNSALLNNISNANLTNAILNYISALVNPLQNEVTEIKGKLPQTVTLPYSCATAVPTSTAVNYGLTNLNGSLWA